MLCLVLDRVFNSFLDKVCGGVLKYNLDSKAIVEVILEYMHE